MDPRANILITISSGKEERSLEYDGKRALSIGRQREADIVLADDHASRSHCEIRPPREAGEPFLLVDLKSRNGTQLNGRPVEEAPLWPGDVVRIGATLITFGAVSPPPELPRATRTDLDPLPRPEPDRPGTGPALAEPGPAQAAAPRSRGPSRKRWGGRRPGRPVLGALGAIAACLILAVFFGVSLLKRERSAAPPPAAVAAGPAAVAAASASDPSPLPVLAAPAPAAVPGPPSGGSPIGLAPVPEGTPAGAAAAAISRAGAPEPEPVSEEELWHALHRDRSGDDLLLAYRDFVERYPAAARAGDARAVLRALDELRSGDSRELHQGLLSSARALCGEERFAEARALLAAGARLAKGQGSPETARQFEEEMSRTDRLAADFLLRRQAELSQPLAEGRAREAFHEVAGLARNLGDLPEFAAALLEFERAFSSSAMPQRPPLAPEAEERIGRARAAYGACRFREAQADYLLALASDPAMGAEDRAALTRRAADSALVARMFEAAVPLLAEKRPEVEGIVPYPARLKGATPDWVEYEVLVEKGQPVLYHQKWEELRDLVKLKLFAAAPLAGEALLGLASFAWEVGDDAAAEAALLRLKKWSDRWEGQLQAALAMRLETPVPEGGFVIYQGHFVDPAEKARREAESEKARARVEAAAKELAGARRDQRTERFLAIALSLREEGHFEAAENLYRAVAARFPASTAGVEAARRIQDPVLRVRPITGSETGSPGKNRITFYFLAEGYPAKDEYQASFEVAARRGWSLLQKDEPYREYSSYLEAAMVNLGSRESGVDRVPGDVKRDTVLGGKIEWDKFSSDGAAVARVLQPIAGKRARLAVVIGNDSASISTGGGGVANVLKGTLGALPHEVGHALGGLHDEYDSPAGNDPHRHLVKGRTGNLKARGRPPNLAEGSVRAEVLQAVPWRHWIEAGEPAWWNRSKVELFEGGGYSPVEVWRPQSNCMMRYGGMFCVACMEAMVKAIYRQVRPIDEVNPVEEELAYPPGAPLALEAVVLKPRTHFLEASWTLESILAEPALALGPARGVPASTVARPAPRAPEAPRALTAERYRRIAPGGRVVEGVRLAPGALVPGVHRFLLEVRDPTPWVLRDEEGLLRQSRRWTVRVGEEPPVDRRRPTGSGGSAPPVREGLDKSGAKK